MDIPPNISQTHHLHSTKILISSVNNFPQMSSRSNGAVSSSIQTQPTHTDIKSKLVQIAILGYDFVLSLLRRPVPTIFFIGKCYWNIFVSMVIVAFLVLVGVYRVLFVVGRHLISAMKYGLGGSSRQRQRRPQTIPNSNEHHSILWEEKKNGMEGVYNLMPARRRPLNDTN